MTETRLGIPPPMNPVAKMHRGGFILKGIQPSRIELEIALFSQYRCQLEYPQKSDEGKSAQKDQEHFY